VTRDARDGFTSTDVGWLEGRLHQILAQAADAELLNSTTPGDDTISEWDRGALERVVILIQGVMRVLGFRPDPELVRPSAEPDDELDVKPAVPGGLDIDFLHRLVAAVQSGEWTTYGDIAAATGSHPRAIGSHIRHCAASDAPEWRVMNRRGESQPGFTWTTRNMGDRSQVDVLAQEGVAFDDEGRADPDAHITAEDLLARVGAPVPARDTDSGGGWLRPLYEAGVLSPGARLVGRYKDVVYEAATTDDGQIEAFVDGRMVTGSPSHTAGAITGSSVNGWTFWRLPVSGGGERALSQLRDETART
jgi:alkylated DNA nucleotide flippase Atl1